MANPSRPEFSLILGAKLALREGLRREERIKLEIECQEKYQWMPPEIASFMIMIHKHEREAPFGTSDVEKILGSYPKPQYACIEAVLHGGFDPDTFLPRPNRFVEEEDEQQVKSMKTHGEKEYARRRNLAQYQILQRDIDDLRRHGVEAEHEQKRMRLLNEWAKAFAKAFAHWGIALPPMWLAVDDLKEVHGEEYAGLKVPALGNHTIFPLVKKLPENSTVLNAVRCAPQSDSIGKSPKEERFPALPNLCWEEVIIAFVSNDSIKIQARNVSERYTFAEVGFKDRRKGDLPDTRWEVLRDDFSENQGEVSFKNRKTKCDLKAAVKEINQRLKTIFSIQENPISYDKKVHAYKTKFKIIDKRYGQ